MSRGMKRKAEGIALLSLYNDDDEEDEEEEENEDRRSSPNGLDSQAPIHPSTSGIVDYGNEENIHMHEDVLQSTQAETTQQEAATETLTTTPDEELAEFLPPPPTSKCSAELQDKFAWFLSLKETGRSFNEELRKSKGYRNPDFLQRAVIHQGVDQIGSCFRKEIFDPHGYDPDDFYDALALQQKQEYERREQERKQSQRVEFVRQSTMAQKMIQKAAVVNPAVTSSNENAAKPEGRTNKKSKWDKVEPDTGTRMMMTTQHTIAAVRTATSFSSANSSQNLAQQQRRKEEAKTKVERKRS